MGKAGVPTHRFRLASFRSGALFAFCGLAWIAARIQRSDVLQAFPILLGILLCLAATARAESDLLLKGGRVIDGSGNPARFADVAIKDGRIAAIGRDVGDAKLVVDVKGLVVAPGFIDVHTHAENIDELPLAENFARMGVTTVVLGNCGSSAADVGPFFRRIEATNVSVNVATLIGHGTVRSRVMGGSFMRPPTAEELGRMRALVEKAMDDGALGLSTGLIYLPGTFSKIDEIVELAKAASVHGGIYASHMRDEGKGVFDAVDELLRIAREARMPAHISHIKLSGNAMWGRHAEFLAAIERARAEGLDITQDQYVYTASSTGISQLVPEDAREGGRAKFKERLSDRAAKARIVAEMKRRLKDSKRSDYAYAVIASYASDPSLNGLNIVQAAKKKRGSGSLNDQIEVILDIESRGGASGVFHGMNEDDLRAFLRHPNTMFASDASVREWRAGVPHPRGYGTNAPVLGRYVREMKILRIEDAIRRMTSLPATTFHLKDRGVLREGAWADVVVFDPAKVADAATFNAPHAYATGLRAVYVNGVSVVENDVHTKARPGKVVRRGE